jgi:glycerol kinase
MAFQSRDVLDAMEKDSGIHLAELKVDGGASVNNHLMQFQADILGTPVVRPVISETTALGAAYLAGLAVGYWEGRADIGRNWILDRRFVPEMSPVDREARQGNWRRAVDRSLGWERPA